MKTPLFLVMQVLMLASLKLTSIIIGRGHWLFMLEAPRPSKIAHSLYMNYGTSTFLLVSSSVSSKKL